MCKRNTCYRSNGREVEVNVFVDGRTEVEAGSVNFRLGEIPSCLSISLSHQAGMEITLCFVCCSEQKHPSSFGES